MTLHKWDRGHAHTWTLYGEITACLRDLGSLGDPGGLAFTLTPNHYYSGNSVIRPKRDQDIAG